MLKSLLAFVLTRRTMVVLALVVFLAGGIAAFRALNIEAYPNPAPVILEVTAQQGGLSAEEMEKYYTTPMEVALYATPGIDNIRSTSFYGLSFIRVTFKYGVDVHWAYAQAALALQQGVQLPGNQTPSINQSSGTGEVLRYQVIGPPHFGLTNLRTVQDWVITRRLQTIPGVVNINSWGGTTKQFDVTTDLHKLQSYGLTVPQVISALGNANINVGGREVAIGQQSVNIRGIGLFDDGGNDDLTKGSRTQDIENVVLAQVNGTPVRIKDVATVSVGNVPRLGILGVDRNDDAVGAILVIGRDYHTNTMLPQINAMIKAMNTDGSLPPGVQIKPYYDRGGLVAITTHTVLENLIVGCVLVFIIQLIFLGDLRSAIIVSLNIPVALLFSIIILVLLGQDANLLSIGAVDFGIIVDSAVILVENMFRIFEAPRKSQDVWLEQMSEGRWGADPTAAREVGIDPVTARKWTRRLRLVFMSAIQIDNSIMFSTLITVAAFIPLFTMTGVEGQIFGPMARTYAFALGGALLATFTITPVIASFLLPRHVEEVETVIVRAMRHAYTPMLDFALNRRKLTVGLGVAFLLVTGILFTRLGGEFLPALEEGNFWIRASLPPTMTLDGGTEATRRIRNILMRYPEVQTVVSQHGRPDNGTDASPFSNIELFVPLKPRDEWPAGVTKESLTDEVAKAFRRELPGVSFNFSQYIQDNIQEAISGVKGANSVKIIGPNLSVDEDLATQIQAQLAKTRGIADIGIFHVVGQPNLNIRIDRERIARYGLNTGDVNSVIQAATGGVVATTLLEGDRQWNVTVRARADQRDSIEKIGDIKVGYQASNGSTAYVPLRELAAISVDTGASYIYHETTKRYLPVKFSVRGRDLAGAVAEAQQRIAQNVHLPNGYRLVWAGEFQDMKEAQARLAVVVPISLVLIVVLLYSLFNSVGDAMLALSGIPFAVGGGILALYLTGLPLSVSGEIGFISLFGVSVMNGILLITYYNQTRAGGLAPFEAMRHAAEQRMRPLMMTALSACIGLLPAALSNGIGSQVQKPLAVVVVGGMLLSPVLLLVVVPAFRLLVAGNAAAAPAVEPPADDAEEHRV